MKLRLAYFGTPGFSAQFLEKMLKDEELPVEIMLVVTQPDKPKGRNQILASSPVKKIAERYKIEVATKLQVANYKLQEIDLALLFAFGQIIQKELIKIPRLGFWNVHPSLLPRYRGAAPMVYPLLLGNRITGVTLIQMDERVDHGPVIAQKSTKIDPHDRRPALEVKLTDLAFDLFKKKVAVVLSTNEGSFANTSTNKLRDSSSRLAFGGRTQNDKEATHTRRLTKQDGFIHLSVLKKALQNNPLKESEIPSLIVDYHKKNGLNDWIMNPRRSAKLVYNFFRGLYPWPGVWTHISISQPPGLRRNEVTGKPRGLNSKRLKITDMDLDDNKLVIKRVQLEGKREVDFEQFRRAYPKVLG